MEPRFSALMGVTAVCGNGSMVTRGMEAHVKRKWATRIWPSSEWELVCCCSRRGDRFRGSAGEKRARELIQAGVDAGLVFRLASVHGVAGLVGYNLCRLETADVHLTGESHAALVRQTARNAAMLEETTRVLCLLGAAGIKVIPFKGPLLALRLYDELGARASADLDFIVRHEDLELVLDMLRSAGHHPRREMDERVAKLHRRAGWGGELRTDASGILMEFNSALGPSFMGFRFGAPELFAEAQPQSIGGVEVLWPRGEELVIALCVHGAKHSWCRLSWLADLQAAWDVYPGMDVRRLMEMARRQRLLRVVKVGHWLARRLLGGEWPAELTAAVDSDARVPTSGRHCREVLFSGQTPGVRAEWRFLAGIRDGAADQIWYTARWALSPSWGDWQCIRLPDGWEWVYGLIRPFRLMLKGCVSVTEVAWRWCAGASNRPKTERREP